MASKTKNNPSGGYTPPSDAAVEQATIGAILVRPEVLNRVAELLEPEDFYQVANGRIFHAMMDLYGAELPVDLVTVTQYLKDRGQLEGCGGPVYLTSLSEAVGFATNAVYYAQQVWKKSQIRKVQAKAKQILAKNPNGNLEEFLTWAESQIFEVTQPGLNRANSFPPLNGTETPVSELLKNPPPPLDYLFNEVLPAGIVGELIAMGGTGKGHLIIGIGFSLATGKNIGPLHPVRKFKVLYLSGEDGKEEIERRVHSAVKALWPNESHPSEVDNFMPRSVVGKLGPLMQYDRSGNPVTAPAYDWLCKSLANLPDVEVLIIDPKSKFFGLDENSNTDCAAWINCLESLVARFNITILFAHHESKAKAGSMEQNSSRGGSAIPDGCRWVANIKSMDSTTAKTFQVTDPRNFVMLDVTKSNYAPKLPAPIYFRRVEGGALTYVELGADRVWGIAEKLMNLLSEEEVSGRHFSRRDLLYDEEAKHITDGLKKAVQGFNRVRDINLAVDHLLKAGWLKEDQVKMSKTGPPKTILRVIATAD